jgi:hypothetical protein
MCLKECESACSRDTCTSKLRAARFTIAKLWNQLRCLTMYEWLKKVRFICTMEYYSVIKKNEIMSFAGKWIEL